MNGEIRFEPLPEDRVASACRLSAQAGWNQTEGDWLRLRRLAPDSLRVWQDGGEVRASFSVARYGEKVAWIGMILVDVAYRGGGLGKATFQAALQSARSSAYEVIGLDATEMGEPIYRKYGFETIGSIVRWGGALPAAETARPLIQIAGKITPEILDLDRRFSGVDRSLLLRDLVSAGATLLAAGESDRPTAYGILREGRNAAHLGPVVGENPESLADLCAAAGSLLEGGEMICDVLPCPGIEALLAGLGLKPLRFLKRMTTPASPGCLSQPGVLCGGGFEWG